MAQIVNQNKMEEEKDKPFAATTNINANNNLMDNINQQVQKQKVVQPAQQPVAPVKTAAVAPQVAKARALPPINQSYNVMKGLMGGRQSQAATSTTNNAITAQKQQALGDIGKEVADYKTANTASTLTPAQIQADFNEYVRDPSSEGGARFASTLNPAAVATAPEFTTSVGYINPSQLPFLDKKGGSVGTKILDQGMISPAQARMKALLTGQANQEISDAINAQTGLVPLTSPVSAKPMVQQNTGASFGLTDQTNQSNMTPAQIQEQNIQKQLQADTLRKQQAEENAFLNDQENARQNAYAAQQNQQAVQKAMQYQNNINAQQAQQQAQRLMNNKNKMDAQIKANAEAKARNDAAYAASAKAKETAAANNAAINAQAAANAQANAKAKIDAENKKALQELMIKKTNILPGQLYLPNK